jgi:hypothetical protein
LGGATSSPAAGDGNANGGEHSAPAPENQNTKVQFGGAHIRVNDPRGLLNGLPLDLPGELPAVTPGAGVPVPTPVDLPKTSPGVPPRVVPAVLSAGLEKPVAGETAVAAPILPPRR